MAYVRNFMSASSSVETFRIGIRPTRSGTVPIVVRAAGTLAGDSLEKFLNVLPDGIERSLTDTVLLLKPGPTNVEIEVTCDVPRSVNPETVTTQISFVEDILGDSLTNLANLLAQPAGCSEQNLARFANAIVIHVYMTASSQLTVEIHNRIMLYIEGSQSMQGGMQKHLMSRMPNGAFRYFTKRTTASTFLTAFTVKMFRQAQTFMTIDQTLIDTALAFILSKQEANGGFYEDPTSEMYQYQGGKRGKTMLAAYIAIILTQSLPTYPQNANARDRAIAFVLQTINNANAFELAITCYALHLMNHASFQSKYTLLLNMATVTADTMYWNVENNNVVLNVETVAYALLFMSKIDFDRSIKLATYLTSKKNKNGGWASTQDTLMAIEALASAAGNFRAYNGTMDIVVWPDYGDLFSLDLHQEDKLNQQTFTLDPRARRVAVIARGPETGKVTASFTCRYFENFDNVPPRFLVTHRLLENCNTPLRSEICISYIPVGTDTRSNMVIMKMHMPSGYVFDPDTPESPLIRVSLILLENYGNPNEKK